MKTVAHSYIERVIKVTIALLFLGALFLRNYNYYFLVVSFLLLMFILLGKRYFGSQYFFNILQGVAITIWVFSQNPLVYNTYIYWLGLLIVAGIAILSLTKFGTKEVHERLSSQAKFLRPFYLILSSILLIVLIGISLSTKQASFFLLGIIIFVVALFLYFRRK